MLQVYYIGTQFKCNDLFAFKFKILMIIYKLFCSVPSVFGRLLFKIIFVIEFILFMFESK